MPPRVDPENPTNRTYGGLDRAYDFFNEQLFGGQLPRCLITMQRKKGMAVRPSRCTPSKQEALL